MIGVRFGLAIAPRAGVALGTGADAIGGGTVAPLLIIASGQSNQLGKMQAASVTPAVYPGLGSSFAAVQLFDHNGGANADPPTFHDEGPRALAARTQAYNTYLVGDAGTELVVGRELTASLGRVVGIAKMAIDGSSLITGWNNPAFPTAGPSLLSQITTFITAQIAAFGISNPAENLVFSWNQGEADTGQAYATYLGALQSFIGALQGTFGNFRVIVHRVTSRNDTAGNVRAALESYSASLGARGTCSYGDDLALRDAAHYTDDAYATLGLRQSAALTAMLLGTPSAAPVWKAGGPPTISSSVQAVTPTLPLHQTGDVFLMVLSGLGVNPYTLSDPQGFVEIAGSPQHDGADNLAARLQVWWKRAASSSETAPTIADVASDDSKMAMVLLVRGCRSSGNPFDVTAGGTVITTTAVSIPGLTTTVANALVIAIATHRIDIATPQFSAFANASLTNLTEHVNLSTSSGAGYGIGIAAGTKAVAGAVSATTATLAATSTQALLSIALAPP